MTNQTRQALVALGFMTGVMVVVGLIALIVYEVVHG